MNNIDKLAAVGLITQGAQLSEEEIAVLGSMSEIEIDALISAKMAVRDGEEPHIPSYHVVF